MHDPGVTRRDLFARGAAAALAVASPSAAQSALIAGTATVDITPDKGLWMAGFARRTQPAQGTALPLTAKALALRYGDPDAMIYHGRPGPFTSDVEERIVREVHRLVR